MKGIIQVKNVFKSYSSKKVLEGISLEIPEGKITTLIGGNGTGKSTLLKIIAGEEKVDSGNVSVFGENPYLADFGHRPDLFFIHENYQMKFGRTLLDMVKIYRHVFPNWSSKLFNKILKERRFSIKKDYAELSRGQQMQFLLILAFAARPKIILLDEITSVIDIEGQRYFLNLLEEYAKEGGTVIITTNILSELNDYTDNLILIQESKIEINSALADIRDDFVILKEIPLEIFESVSDVSFTKKSGKGERLYVSTKEAISQKPILSSYLIDEPPRLEDILILYFDRRLIIDHEEIAS